MFQIKFIL